MDAVIGCLVSLYLLAGVILNLLVIVAVLKKGNHTFKDVLMISLACSLLSEICFGFVWEGYGRFIDDSSLELCKIAGFGATFSAFVSIIQLMGLVLERYVSIIHPVTAQSHFRGHTVAMLFVIPSWVFCIVWASLPFYGWGEYMREAVYTYRCSVVGTGKSYNARSYNYSMLIFFFFAPILIITYLLVRAQIRLTMTRKMAAARSTGTTATTARIYKYERHHFILTCFVIIMFFLTWTPYAVSGCGYTFFDSSPQHVVNYSALFAKSGLVTNPIIYVLLNKELRKTLKRTIFGRKPLTTTNMQFDSITQ
uniref:Opsin n=1 Tax=Cladonema radiatum TaxID=264074 RepID=A9CR36_9CNID|nr:opsin [Cladonema radiatum]